MSPASVRRLWRFYQAAIVNTVFGYGLFALMITAGLNMFVAQIVAHVLGVTFNYFSYSRHVFRDASASKLRFLLSYALNYFVGLAALAGAASIIASPYIAGFAALVVASLINFVILKSLVFTRTAA